MNYYILAIISIVITIIVQISISQSMQIASVVPNLLIIPLIFFTLIPRQKHLEGLLENTFRGTFLGFIAGFCHGINSMLLWADIFSWTLVGFLLGLVSGPIKRENPIVKTLLLFSSTFLQGIFFFIPLSFFRISPLFFWRLLFSSFYTILLGILILKLIEIKRKER